MSPTAPIGYVERFQNGRQIFGWIQASVASSPEGITRCLNRPGRTLAVAKLGGSRPDVEAKIGVEARSFSIVLPSEYPASAFTTG